MRRPGILRIAFKLLVNDRGKFSALLLGITFAVFLMVQITSMFAGILGRASANIINIGAPVWVMDPAVKNTVSSIPMPGYLLDAVRSIEGVSYAVPLYLGGAQARLADGTFQAVSVIGLDDSTLLGRPAMLEGALDDIYAENGFLVVKDAEFYKLGNPHLGTVFELNDHRATIVGITQVASNGLFGVPTLYTTYSRATEYLPTTRFTTSYILVWPKDPSSIESIRQKVAALGYLALTREDFMSRVSRFYTFETGMGTNILIMTLISFIVGLSISGQTFYTFILENLEKFGALKAIGAKGRELVWMILFQASFTALTGYGLGIGLVAILMTVAKIRLPDYAAMLTGWNLGLAFAMVLVIAAVSSVIGVRKVLAVEPFDIFRG
jgi:putative ABC transport system permease protein